MGTLYKSRRKVWFSKVFILFLIASIALPGYGLTMAEQSKSPANLDILFIGAHPDDEASNLSTFGQWNEYEGIKTGVITVTRGEGGGNAVGPEEGAALGLIREREERNAVSKAGIEHVYNLDKLDFYYTVSAPLAEEIWGHDATLEKIVRIIRMTRPEIIFTMNPSPTPGNHGHHQFAARLAVEAFYAAADPDMYSEQLDQEGLQPWRAKKILMRYAAGEGQKGQVCESNFTPLEPTDKVFGVWNGRYSEKYRKTWGQIEREAQREYVSQGWAVFPDVSADPQELNCDQYTEIDSRVPDMNDQSGPNAILKGALQQVEGGLPLGTEFYLTTDQFSIARDQTFTVTAHIRSADKKALHHVNVRMELPQGWTAEGDGLIAVLEPDQLQTVKFKVTPSADAEVKRYRLKAQVTAGSKSGFASRVVSIAPDVRGTLQPLPQVAQFRAWAEEAGVMQLDNLIKPVLSIGVGETRIIEVDLKNYSDQVQSGTVALNLPAGFKAAPAKQSYKNLQPGAAGKVSFEVTNINRLLKTSNEGGVNGDYNFTVETISSTGKDMQNAALNLVPVTTIHRAKAEPVIDGMEGDDEYPGAYLDLSRVWEGTKPSSSADASGKAKVTWFGDSLYFIIHVEDDVLGTVLSPEDAKRHWRTDAVEIAIDPQGTSENTSTTFKVGIFPITDDPANGNPPAAYRDADHSQGPIASTASGMVVRSKVSEPYTGYTIEAKIPMSVLPAPIDPKRMGLNIFIYDSDTQDKTGQSRLGWSTWGGVQGDPYRWGHAYMPEYEPPLDLWQDVGHSTASPQSIIQSLKDGIPLGGARPAYDVIHIVSSPQWQNDSLIVELQAEASGKANLFIWSDGTIQAAADADLMQGKSEKITLQLSQAALKAAQADRNALLLIAFETQDGATARMSSALPR